MSLLENEVMNVKIHHHRNLFNNEIDGHQEFLTIIEVDKVFIIQLYRVKFEGVDGQFTDNELLFENRFDTLDECEYLIPGLI